ncbi:MAG TPA: hypothetical protein VFY48_03560 [Solirubrobacterales bacterium]|nr:hypothetical protein [Solirubrobacterales bacterium]
MPRRRVSPAALVFALLVLATVAAFGWAQRLKRDPLVLDRVTFGNEASRSFTPNGDCRFDQVRVRFRTTVSDDGTVQVVKPGGRVVVTLARDEFLKRYTFHTFYWDGRRRGGGVAPPGRYKLRVKLLNEDRTLVTPGAIKLHRAKRGVESACAEEPVGTGGVGPGGTARPAP